MRSNMPEGPINHSDFALGVVGDEDEYVTMSITPSLLIDDDNILAVEIHQANATSSDTSFDLELKLERPLEPKVFLTQISETKSLLIWANSIEYELEESNDLLKWAPVENAESPMEIDHSNPGRLMFFRLKKIP